MSKGRLTKHPTDRVWAGVSAGIGAWLGLDPVLLRLAWLAWAVFGDTGTAILAYVALMIVMPDATRDERAAAKRRAVDPFATTVPAHATRPAVPAAATAARPAAASATAPGRVDDAGRAPSPTADELGDVVLKLLDATAAVAVSIGRAAVLAARAAVLSGRAAYRAPAQRRAAGGPARARPAAAPAAPQADVAAPPAAAPLPAAGARAADGPTPTAHAAPAADDDDHLESDEERLHRQLRQRLDAQVDQARSTLSAVGATVAARERSSRRRRLRQVVGFGVLACGVWALSATANVSPVTLTGTALATLGGAGVVLAAAFIGLGTYLLWTAVRGR